MEKQCVNINPNPDLNFESQTKANEDEYLEEIEKRKYWYFLGSRYDDVEGRLNTGLAWLGGMLVKHKHSPHCNSSEVLIAFNTVDEMLSTVRQVPADKCSFGVGDLPKLAENPMRTGFVKSELMKAKLITGPEPDKGWGGPSMATHRGNIPSNGQLRLLLVVHPSPYMLQTLDAIPEIFAMMVLSWYRNDITRWIEARDPVNLDEVRFRTSNR